jgi:hypothetical protein
MKPFWNDLPCCGAGASKPPFGSSSDRALDEADGLIVKGKKEA